MIKTIELRRGNYFLACGTNYEKVDSISEKIVNGFNANSPTAVCPIPLTEELLLKIGWVNNDDKSEYGFDDYTHSEWNGFECGWASDGYFIFELLDQTFGTDSPTIRHLHQLQNIFYSMTGTELTINL